MHNAAKITFAFLLSLLLAGTQSVLLAAAPPSAPASCACPGCKKACCAAKGTAPAPQPAAPTRAADQSALFMAVLVRLVAFSPSSTAQVSSAYSSAPSLAAVVPLYQRNCSYLI